MAWFWLNLAEQLPPPRNHGQLVRVYHGVPAREFDGRDAGCVDSYRGRGRGRGRGRSASCGGLKPFRRACRLRRRLRSTVYTVGIVSQGGDELSGRSLHNFKGCPTSMLAPSSSALVPIHPAQQVTQVNFRVFVPELAAHAQDCNYQGSRPLCALGRPNDEIVGRIQSCQQSLFPPRLFSLLAL